MKRRSKAGGEPIKRRRPTTPKPTRRNAPKVEIRSKPSPVAEEKEVALLARERDQALEQQTAASEVLHVIRASPGELELVFQAMLERAVRLCEAKFGNIYRWDGEALHILASHNTPPAFAEAVRRSPYRPYPNSPIGRMVANRTVAHINDVTAEEVYLAQRDPTAMSAVALGGIRTLLGVPLLNKGQMIGAFFLSRQEVRLFTEKQIALVQSFADQAVIAIENARLLNELRQSLKQQTATADVLKAISRSTFDLQPVLDALVETAAKLCAADMASIATRDGEVYRVKANYALNPEWNALLRTLSFRPGRDTVTGRTLLERQTVQIADITTDPEYALSAAASVGKIRTVIGVPLLREGDPTGVMQLARSRNEPFTERQIELIRTFADQAAIAIENARLLNELRQRTTDLTEALEQQTATADILRVISSSPSELDPVFRTMLEKAVRICDAKFGALYLAEGDGFRAAAMHNAPPAYEDARAGIVHPPPSSSLWRAANTKQAAQIADVMSERGYAESDPFVVSAVALGGYRSVFSVPMLHEDKLIGVITIFRQEVRPFTDKEIALVQNFAAQAIIAIENARLLNELRQRTDDLSQRTADLTEALEQQTATSDVLKVISSSPSDLQPVFDTMLANATRLCEATHGHVWTFDGEQMHAVAVRGDAPFVKWLQEHNPVRPIPGSAAERIVLGDRFVHVADRRQEPAYRDNQTFRGLVDTSGIRASLSVALRKGETLLGMINVYRQDVRPFTDNQIKLVEDFASQAVIAIENARLLNELRQSLDQQTATANVLEVISRSVFDLGAVFETVAESSVRLCGADRAFIFRFDGELLRMAASYNATPEFAEWVRENPIRPGRHSGSARAALERRTIHITDVRADPEYVYGAKDVEAIRTVLGVPILKGDQLFGVMMIYHLEVRPFTNNQIALVETFADQAAIAIENVRLFEAEQQRARENARLLTELRERTVEVEKLNQQLEHRVADQVGEIERMSRLRRFLPPQVADLIVASGTEKELESHRREITALFCDLRGFTGFSESADPEDVMALLREYHAAIGDSIIKYSGTLERYAGDGVMVVFNDPVPVDNPALQAVLMALEMRDAIATLTETWRRWGHDIGFGIGIAHGFATLGTIGFEGRFDYAAIGTVSNVASRLCDEAKPGQILISPRVLTKVENAVAVEPVGEFALKGIRRPLAAYNVLATTPSKI